MNDTRRRRLVLTFVLCAHGMPIHADELAAPGGGERGKLLLAAMSAEAVATDVRVGASLEAVSAALQPAALMRYTDQPRGFEDATLWGYVQNGRIVALQKVEACLPNPYRGHVWGYCFASTADAPLTAVWDYGQEFVAEGSAMQWHPLDDAPPPNEFARRKLQARELARRFTASTVDATSGERQDMRLLPRPVYELTKDAGRDFRGALFAIAANGTNPDLILFLEITPNNAHWRYAVVRMTNAACSLSYQNRVVLEIAAVHADSGRFETWLYFDRPRSAEPEHSHAPQEVAP